MLYCLCKNNDDNTYHLFECKKELNGCYLKSGKSFCKKETLSNSYKHECKFTCEDIKEARIKIAELANKGEQICGVCVSTLYKNE